MMDGSSYYPSGGSYYSGPLGGSYYYSGPGKWVYFGVGASIVKRKLEKQLSR